MSILDIISYVWLGILAIGIITLIVRGISKFDFREVTWSEIKGLWTELWGGLKIFLCCALAMFFVAITSESFGHSIYEWQAIWTTTILGGICVMVAYYINPEKGDKE